MAIFEKSVDEQKEQKAIVKRLEIYEATRKLAIDEDLSEWRRTQKNRAVEEVLKNTEAWRVDTQKKFASFHSADKAHGELVSTREAEIKALDAAKKAKMAEVENVQKDFEARSTLRDRALKAEKEAHVSVLAEKDKHIAYLTGLVTTFQSQTSGLLAEAVKHLGAASNKDAITKVVGFGPSSEPKKV